MILIRKSFLGILVILIIGLSSCQSQETNPEETQDRTENYIQFESNIFSTGIVVPIEIMNLSFSLSGQVMDVLVREGETIEAGDLIAVLDKSSLLSDLTRAEANFALAQARYDKVLAGTHPYQLSEAEFEATSVASGSVLSLAEATAQAANAGAAQARLDYLLAQPLPEDIAIAEAELEQARVEVERVKTLIARTELIAPVDGTILNVYIHAYEYTAPGQSIVQMGDIRSLVIQTRLDDIEAAEINIGDPAIVTFIALQDVEVDGSVAIIKTVLDEVQDKNFIVLISLEDPPASVRAGMVGDIKIRTE